MKANTAQRFRLYPDVMQAERLTAWSHTCRAVWNIALAQRIWAFRSAQRATVRGIDQCRELTEARREHGWLRDLPAQCAQQVLRHLDAAYENFWNPAHRAEIPRFKKKYHRQAVPLHISALKARQARRRADWNHELTTDLANSHGLIAVEDLSVRNMIRSARGTVERPGTNIRQKVGLNRLIADQGWFDICRQLGYKTRRCRGVLVAVPAAGISQTCSKCGVRDPESRQGCARLFACVHCGHSEHADRNVALNIRDRALSTAGWAGTTMSGRGGSQSTRSPQRQGTHWGSRMREPSSAVSAERPGGISRHRTGEDVKRG